MVTHNDTDVKPCKDCGRDRHNAWQRMWCWVDSHPRYWWFWTIMLLLNTVLNLLDITGFGTH
jgi:hypothetical protein